MKILVTGGAGYIGSSLVEELNKLSSISKVIVYDNLSRNDLNFFLGKNKLEKVRFIQGDILDSFLLDKSIADVDIVIHLAGYVSFPYNHLQNLQYEQINRWGSLNVVRAIEKSKTVKRAVYLSSLAVLGFGSNIKNDDIASPANTYGSSKYEGEKYFELLKENFDVSIVRSGNVFGFNRALRLDGVINAFFFDALVKGEIKIYGNGTQTRPFVSLKSLISKLCNWITEEKYSATIISADFNASLNNIKDWIVKEIPSIQYTYLNQNQKFLSQSVVGISSFKLDNPLLKSAFDHFQESLRIRK